MSAIYEFLGRLHPLVVHLPLTLLVIGGAIEACRLKAKSTFFSQAALWCFGLGALGALIAVGTGWSLGAHSHHPVDERHYVELHRWFAIATAIAACGAYATQLAWRDASRPAQSLIRRLFAWGVTLLIIITGHLGALAVWGADWFS